MYGMMKAPLSIRTSGSFRGELQRDALALADLAERERASGLLDTRGINNSSPRRNLGERWRGRHADRNRK